MTVPQKTQARFSLTRLLIGDPLPTRALVHQTVNRIIGLAVFASDALSSTAYATEEILIILAMTGLSASVLGLSIPIAIAIGALLVIVTVSYRQTIYAYPKGGGAYIVARDNLGELPAQIAGAALLTDYILTVAVSISSGVAQITSGLPELAPYRVEIAVGIIILMTIVNLRGVRESGFIFSIPTYFFLAIMFLTLGIGFVRVISGTLPTVTDVEPIQHVVEPLTLFLVLRAFSSGCTALTGIEAISNGITAFKEPRSRNAASTLTAMSVILITLFLGITLLAHGIQAVPSESETVISQIGRTVHGQDSVLYGLTLAGTTLILLMAANTSYADFPRLAALHAGDGFLPRHLTYRGNRLVFSWGIAALAVLASALVIVMGARTTALIPLYAIGVFLSFTMSQAGMVVRLRKIGWLQPGETVQGLETVLEYDPRWRTKMFISAFGAVTTGVVMVVFAVTKFTAGAWFVVFLIPTLVFIFFRIHYHYEDVARALSLRQKRPDIHAYSVQTLILVDGVHAETVRVVNFAKSLGHPWKAIHVAVNPQKAETIRQDWDEYIGEGELGIIPSPYRSLIGPIREYVEGILDEKHDTFVQIIMGHLVMDTFWEQALHQNSALILNLALGDLDRVVVTIVPYQIHRNGGAKADGDNSKPQEAIKAPDLVGKVQPDGNGQ
jgi:amino acid transporter